MLQKVKTILEMAEVETEEKKSKFIAHVSPAHSEEEAQAFIEKIRKEHWNATHNVFAYQVGEKNEIQRYSDDGEPSGTAGLPVLNVLRGEELRNIVIVVTRYFGGTLLGTGGLVRAYGRCAKEGVVKAKIIEKKLHLRVTVQVDYSMIGKMQYTLLEQGVIVEDTIYAEQVTFILLVEKNKIEYIDRIILEITKGQGKTNLKEDVYVAQYKGENLIFEE